ncbi:hypothetical protein GCM10009555_089050 [Acrocarpospora macrocephala]|uniref:Methyltransferase domain-containing protein n=1 Tax=Acrocarpospora macrocephala TaxID=150177 RepID=A0A5M3X7F6_9ACTN|nr:class I SAM-dependent methyltransferase [Acrocarpospora macrocephala]GES14118.1 hypothetical protein Amac_077150 [Acrocarpospora macrocephala]
MTARLSWAVDALDIVPTDHILEIGCGSGTAVSLISSKLTTGKVVALDRSPKMIALAERRNHDAVTAGKAIFRTADFENADFVGEQYDKILAVNVNLFWVRHPTHEMALIEKLLKPEGFFFLCYEPPSGRAPALSEKLLTHLKPFTVDVTTKAPDLIGFKISV